MKAMVLEAYGGIDQLKWRELPDPKPGAGQVRVTLSATSVNPIDYKLRSGSAQKRMPLQLPAVLGRDVAGTVAELGAGVTSVRVGDRVLGLGMASYAEQVVIAADVLAPIPAELDAREAGALPLVLTTGGQLAARVEPKSGDTILITGALGGVGRAALYAAKQRGARVIAGVRARQRQEAAELGAGLVLAVDDDADIERLPRLDAIADTVSGEVIGKLLGKLEPGGILGSVLGEPPAAKGKPIEVRAFMAQPDAKLLAELAQAVARGELRIPIAKRLPLAQAAEAQRIAEEEHPGGKILLLA